ncbi:MAG TPA: beta-propeller domain-containing protein [Bacilli bacterium]|nr:beta-propeller domain-containing protein [Bacilli bacterium]
MLNLKSLCKTLFLSVSLFSFATLGTSCGSSLPNPTLAETQLKEVGSKSKLLSLIDEAQQSQYGGMGETGDVDVNVTPGGTKSDQRDYTGTNVQVEGVDEGDIVKTDGYQIYYAPRYMNRVHIFNVDDDHVINYQGGIDLGDTFTDALYLLDNYLVVVGYTFDSYKSGGCPIYYDGDDLACIEMMWWYPTGTVIVFDRDTLQIVYQIETDSNFLDHRLIEDSLFLVGHKYLYAYDQQTELRPQFFINGSATPEYVDYSKIFYFEETPANGMTVLTGIKLNDDPNQIEYSATAYLGAGYSYKQIYVSLNNLYVADTNWISTENSYGQTMTISQFSIDIDAADMTFVGAAIVEGGMLNQFAMDEYDGYLRVATTYQGATWKSVSGYYWYDYERVVSNHLYILKIDPENQTFDLIAHLSEGLGKPGESIKSVRFIEEQAYIVTFLQTDPLYIIDLSEPSAPTITDEVHLLGFDTYQHPWGENRLLGLGYQADEQGMVEGIKLTAYNVAAGSASEIQTYELTVNHTESQSNWTYSYSEALWNHKALLVSVDHGIFGFPVQAYEYGYTTDGESEGEQNWYSNYHSYYYLFKVDFTKESPIAEPIIIEHANSEQYYVNVDRAVMIDGFVYTLSDRQVITYDLNTSTLVSPTLDFSSDL